MPLGTKRSCLYISTCHTALAQELSAGLTQRSKLAPFGGWLGSTACILLTPFGGWLGNTACVLLTVISMELYLEERVRSVAGHHRVQEVSVLGLANQAGHNLAQGAAEVSHSLHLPAIFLPLLLCTLCLLGCFFRSNSFRRTWKLQHPSGQVKTGSLVMGHNHKICNCNSGVVFCFWLQH